MRFFKNWKLKGAIFLMACWLIWLNSYWSEWSFQNYQNCFCKWNDLYGYESNWSFLHCLNPLLKRWLTRTETLRAKTRVRFRCAIWEERCSAIRPRRLQTFRENSTFVPEASSDPHSARRRKRRRNISTAGEPVQVDIIQV